MSRVVVSRALQSIDSAMKMTKSAITDAARAGDVVYRAQAKELWATEGASGGEPWLELNPDYLKWKQRQRHHGRQDLREAIKKFRAGKTKALKTTLLMSTRILVQFGSMRDAFSTLGRDHHAQGFIIPTGGRVQLGALSPADRPDWSMHAKGIPTGAGKGGLPPQRDPNQRLQVQEDQIREAIKTALIPHIMRSARIALQAGPPRRGGSGA
jgi:hypothetical protein